MSLLLLMCLSVRAQEISYQDSIDLHAFDVCISNIDVSKAHILETSVSKGYVSEDGTAEIDVLEGGALKVDVKKMRVNQRGVRMLE
jgi:hypothetical protein